MKSAGNCNKEPLRCPLLLCKVHTQLLELMMNTPRKDMNHNQDESLHVTGKDEHNTKDSHTAFQMLTGFMFGNIDEKEKLVEDVLDKDSKHHLASLSHLDELHSLVKNIVKDEHEKPSVEESTVTDVGSKPSAVNCSNIRQEVEEELPAQENQSSINQTPVVMGENLEPENEKSSKLMSSQSLPTLMTGKFQPVCKADPPSENDANKARWKAPLASNLPPELASIDVTNICPEFRPDKVLRFSRLFKPSHKPNLWRKHRKVKCIKTVNGRDNVESRECKGKSEGEGLLAENAGNIIEDNERGSVNKIVKDICENNFERTQTEEFMTHEELNFYLKLDKGRLATTKECVPDNEDLQIKPGKVRMSNLNQDNNDNEGHILKVAPWRYGPAQLWYDRMEVDETGEDFNYGFKLISEEEKDAQTSDVPSAQKIPVTLDDDAYLMVNQVHWEDDIIWDGDAAKQRVLQSYKSRAELAGWVPSNTIRTAAQFLQLLNITSNSSDISDRQDTDWYSIFPIENEALIYHKWENDIIWDAQVSDLLVIKPPIMTLDPNDHNLILEIPKDFDPKETKNRKLLYMVVLFKQEIRQSKILLSKAGIIKDEEEKVEAPSAVKTKDQFNLSNDEHYNPKIMDTALQPSIGSSLIQHSAPASELFHPFFPTFMGPTKLRSFHRQPLKKYSHGTMAETTPQPVRSLRKIIARKAKMREQEKQAFGGGEIFFMRTPQDLTGMDGDLILAEYSEEFPPILNQVGMASKIKNYYKRTPGKDTNSPIFKYGELAYAYTSPFLGSLAPGCCLQAIENNLFRAPIYEHDMPRTDFLIIRTRQHYYIREVNTIYCVGQECPLYEVPGPNSKRAISFVRDFQQAFIYRLFWKSKDNPRRIKMEEIKKAFPSHSENSIRKRLKLCADFQRTGMHSNWWVLKKDFRLPSEEEILAMVSPEQCCAWYSMITAEQRLKDAGYGEKSLFALEEDNEEETQTKLDDEVRAAPWNTTRAFIAAMKGKCLLQLDGVADPTGCGEGFSFVKMPNNKPTTKEGTRELLHKRTLVGTDADLRRLSFRNAKELLRKFGVPESDIRKLGRWETVEVVRTLSTEQAKQDQDNSEWKFARGNRHSAAEHTERYKRNCQRIFDLQNRILASAEALSTDEEFTSDEESDFEEMGKNIESMLDNKKTISELTLEKEEAERLELQRMMRGDNKEKESDQKASSLSDTLNLSISLTQEGRKLKITRTFLNETGKPYTRSEIIRSPGVISAYLRIRQTKDPSFIKQFVTMDEETKLEMRKERRRLQEQLRRIKRNQQKPEGLPPVNKPKKKKESASLSKMKCGACGAVGHMRTNKECPLYVTGEEALVPGATMGENTDEEAGMQVADEELINVEGTKIILSKAVFDRAKSVQQKSLVLRLPKVIKETKKKRQTGSTLQSDYAKRPKLTTRCRADPLVTLSSMFETILNEMRILPNTQLFLHPVNPKNVPDYYTIVQKPMDLQTMRENNRKMKYQTRELFLNDLNQIFENSKIYNGWAHLLTVAAQSMLDRCLQRFAEREHKFMRLEKAINPLLDDNDQVALSYMFEIIIGKMKAVENSWPFHQPVSKKNLKDYCSIIKKPMDLATLLKNVQDNKYNTREQFMKDVQLLYTNSLSYNGPDSSFTQTAKRMIEVCHDSLSENEEYFAQLEADIVASKEAALDGLDSESVMTETSLHLEDSLVGGGSESGDSYLDDNTIAKDDLTSLSLQPQVFHQPQEASSDSEIIDVEGDSSDELASKMTCIPSRKRRFSQVETDIDVCQVPDDIYTPYDIVEDRDHTDAVAEDDRHDDILGK
ncbi:hypothetical protein C0Q70_05490 [Pomacea canaliculata]|uniref:Transcription initiation factor TFIID subunit 1 n=1 Tax=Pomacea canaliculata TaxID=400727 RepID=A0A2T7PLE5_POMCA|nr:hypothetical protein C0Q70_05490 [Pomacea canaliculata]